MKVSELPSHDECAELMESGEANFLHIFIHESEPCESNGLWRKQLADAITRIQRDTARAAWADGQISLLPDAPITNIDDYLESEYPIEA